MKEIAKELNSELEIRDARQIINNNSVEIHFHPDDRGFALITCKLYDESFEHTLNNYIKRYRRR